MSYVYSAGVAYYDANKRFVNLTEAPTLTAHNLLTGAALAGAITITNIATGRYRVQVTDATLTDVIFGVVPAVADQTLHGDVAVMQEKVYHVADDIVTEITSLNDLDAAGIRTAVGLASANLDTQLGTIDGNVDDVKAVTDQIVFTEPNRVDASATVDAQAVADAIEPLIPTPENIWTYVKRTLTMTPAEVLAYITQTSITQVRGNTWEIPLTDLTLAGDKQQFVIKRHTSQPDEDAILFVDDLFGLLIVDGEDAEDETQADLDYTGTTLTLKVDAKIAAQLAVGNYIYGIQTVSADSEETVVSEVYSGIFTITADVVRATE